MSNLEELSKLRYKHDQFDSVLSFVSQIQSANTPECVENCGVACGMVVLGLGDLRDDVIVPSLPLELTLSNAKRQDGKYFVVPQVVE